MISIIQRLGRLLPDFLKDSRFDHKQKIPRTRNPKLQVKRERHSALVWLASLKMIDSACSSLILASWAKKRLAPSTVYLNRGVSSRCGNRCTSLTLTTSGRPPHETKMSVEERSCKWNSFLNVKPSSTN